MGLTFKIGDLGISMHTGICPAGPCQGNFLTAYGEDGLFDLFLDGTVIFLTLLAMVACPVVLDGYFKIFCHCIPII